jgi:hypothetical protein
MAPPDEIWAKLGLFLGAPTLEESCSVLRRFPELADSGIVEYGLDKIDTMLAAEPTFLHEGWTRHDAETALRACRALLVRSNEIGVSRAIAEIEARRRSTQPTEPPSRRSLGLVGIVLAAVAILGIVIGVLATRHSSVTGSASAGAGSQSATEVNSTIAQSPLDQLTAIAEQDQSAVQSLAENYWVPILSSKKVGTVDPRDAQFPNQAYTNEMILQNFTYWHSRYSSALLLQSSSYSSLIPGYWVIILNQRYSAPGDVISWCKAQDLNDDDCDATLLSNQLPNGPHTYQGW